MRRTSDNHYHTNNVIIEEKAPTDEAIKLLNEMQDKANENIITRIDIIDNVFNAISIVRYDNIRIQSYCIDIKFTLNKQEYYIEINESMEEFRNIMYKCNFPNPNHNIINVEPLRDFIAKAIANAIAKEFVKIIDCTKIKETVLC